jgi:hypothetical protein
MKITIDLDNDAAIALATIIRRLTPDDYADALRARGVEGQAWYRALDALSPHLPEEPPKTNSPDYPGEPGSRADIGRRRFLLDEIESRARLHPLPSAAELAYRQRLADELDRA